MQVSQWTDILIELLTTDIIDAHPQLVTRSLDTGMCIG